MALVVYLSLQNIQLTSQLAQFNFQVKDSLGQSSNTYIKLLNVQSGNAIYKNVPKLVHIHELILLYSCNFYSVLMSATCNFYSVLMSATAILIYSDVNVIVSDSATLASMSPPQDLDSYIQTNTALTVQTAQDKFPAPPATAPTVF